MDYAGLTDYLHAPPEVIVLPWDDRHPGWHSADGTDVEPLRVADANELPPHQRLVVDLTSLELMLPRWEQWAGYHVEEDRSVIPVPRRVLAALARRLCGGGTPDELRQELRALRGQLREAEANAADLTGPRNGDVLDFAERLSRLASLLEYGEPLAEMEPEDLADELGDELRQDDAMLVRAACRLAFRDALTADLE